MPRAFETWASDTSFVRGPSKRAYSSRMTCPRSSTGATRRRAPVSSQSRYQGTMFAWCSSQVMTISSPLPTFFRPQAWATRLMASVPPRT